MGYLVRLSGSITISCTAAAPSFGRVVLHSDQKRRFGRSSPQAEAGARADIPASPHEFTRARMARQNRVVIKGQVIRARNGSVSTPLMFGACSVARSPS